MLVENGKVYKPSQELSTCLYPARFGHSHPLLNDGLFILERCVAASHFAAASNCRKTTTFNAELFVCTIKARIVVIEL